MEKHASEMQVLLVDSQRHLRPVLAPILRQVGLRQIFTADSIPEAIRALTGQPVELILIDHDSAPDETLPFVECVRTPGAAWNAETPMILLAQTPGMGLICAARDRGVNQILAKPVTTARVIDCLRRTVLNRRAAPDPNYAGPERRRRNPEDDEAFARARALTTVSA